MQFTLNEVLLCLKNQLKATTQNNFNKKRIEYAVTKEVKIRINEMIIKKQIIEVTFVLTVNCVY